MQEVISSILQAEKKAEEILEKATQEAKAQRLSGDAEAEKIRAKAIDSFKAHRVSVLEKAESDAQAEYDKTVKQGKEQSAKRVGLARENLLKAADYLVDKVIR